MRPEEIQFEAPAYTGALETYSFSGEDRTVLAFFPGAFTDVCTEEMCMIRDSLEELNDLGTEVIAVSVDTPFALERFAEENDIEFTMVSDQGGEISSRYGVDTEMPGLEYTVATRALFVVEENEVVYRQVLDDPTELPDLDDLKSYLRDTD
jgi:Peroxiredoxin